MCWSAEVSWAFASLDLVFVAVLLWQRQRQRHYHAVRVIYPHSLHGMYAAFLAAIAAQEWAQFALPYGR
jgi:hypothetical protein